MSTPNMKSLVIGVVSVLAVGGIAVASYGGLGSGPRAEVLSSEAIRVTEPVFAEVLKVTPVQEQRPVSRQQCSERTVQRRAPERFGDKDGMVVGAVVGGLLGNQVGGGSGRAAATAAGVLAGGAIGKEADRRHTGGRRYEERVQDCRQVQDSETVVVGYDVDYRGETGAGQLRLAQSPGKQVQVGERERVIGYDVRWRYGELTGESRLREAPGKTLPVVDGKVAPDSVL
jgi:uncharacterized protein YcfJ